MILLSLHHEIVDERRNCPGLKIKSRRLLKLKGHGSFRSVGSNLRSLDVYADTGVSSAATIRLTAGIRPSATERTRRAGPRANRARRVAWKAGRFRAGKVLQALC